VLRLSASRDRSITPGVARGQCTCSARAGRWHPALPVNVGDAMEHRGAARRWAAQIPGNGKNWRDSSCRYQSLITGKITGNFRYLENIEYRGTNTSTKRCSQSSRPAASNTGRGRSATVKVKALAAVRRQSR
jgi:hypothetical protein